MQPELLGGFATLHSIMKGSAFTESICGLVLLVGAACCISTRLEQTANPGSPQMVSTVKVSENLPGPTWQNARYRGLQVGSSTRENMLSILGKPTSSGVSPAPLPINPKRIVWYRYKRFDQGKDLLPEKFFEIGIDKLNDQVLFIYAMPKDLSLKDAIGRLGNDYIQTSYALDGCFMDGERPAWYESPSGTYVWTEYREKGIALQSNRDGAVTLIFYLSNKLPIGNAASLCNQPAKGLAYIACGCGCCGGEPGKRECLYRAKGDDLMKVIQQDAEMRRRPLCATVGCNMGVKYVYCD